MQKVSWPIQRPQVESAINYYQTTSILSGINYTPYSGTQLKTGAINLINQVNNYGATMLNYFWKEPNSSGNMETIGHSVLVLSCSYNTSRNGYELLVFDPNATALTTRYLTYSSSGVTFYGINLSTLSFYTRDTLNFWNAFDLDGTYNDMRTAANTLTDNLCAEEELTCGASYNDTALLILPYVEFKIQNAEGQILQYCGEEFEGDLEVVSWQVVPKGPDQPAELQLTVRDSNEFTCEMKSELVDFSATFKDFTGGASGTGIDSITVKSSGQTKVMGDEMHYRLGGMLEDADYVYISLEGTGDGVVTLQSEMPWLDVASTCGNCKFYVLDQNGIELQSEPFSMPAEKTTMELVNQMSGPAIQFQKEEKIWTLSLQQIYMA